MKKLVIAIGLILGCGLPAFAQQDILKSSTAYKCLILMIDSSDHITGKSGATVTVTISKNGGSFGTPASGGTATGISSGWYYLALSDAADTGTDGTLALHATASGADPTDIVCGTVVEYDPRSATTLQNIVDAVLNELLSGHTTAGTVAKKLSDTYTAVLAARALPKSTATKWAMQFSNSAGALVTTGTPTCTRAIDQGSFSAVTNSPSAVDANGISTLTLSTSDTNATDIVILKCTLTSARTYYNIFRIQQ